MADSITSKCDRIFSFRMPAVTMGTGARSELSGLVQPHGKNALIVTDPGIGSQDSFREIVADLEKSGCKTAIFGDVVPDPPLEVVEKCAAQAREVQADIVIGIGGGSALDVAKVAAIVAQHGYELPTLFGTDEVPQRGLPTVLLPTTAGTGSEVTPIAVLSDEEHQLKRGIVSDHLLADHALVDPELCLTLPPGPTAYTGMDTLTHGIEAYTNKHAVPLIDSYALEVVRLVGKSLETAVKEPSNMAARYDMSLASLLGGLCLKSVNTAAVHALAYPLGGRFHVPHGVANSLLLPHVMRFNAPVSSGRYSVVAECLGSDDAVAAVQKISAAVGTDKRMRDFGVEEQHLTEMATSAMEVQRLLVNNPREVTEADALAIYEAAW